VLVVSEDLGWAGDLVARLDGDGYRVRADADGAATREPGCPFDVVVVDLAITTASPLAVVAALRARSSIPILAVAPAGHRSVAVLSALEAGADQVLTRGTRLDELMARVRALLRQSPPRARSITAAAADRVPSIRLDRTTGVAVVAGREVVFSAAERELLHALLARPDLVVTRTDLIDAHPGGLADGGLDALVRGIRTKLETIEGRRRIVAVRGVGFRLVSDVELGLTAPGHEQGAGGTRGHGPFRCPACERG
jgi:two-component system OmpR family response regulator